MADSDRTRGFVLCGGRSSRMGSDKALIGDPPWAERVARALAGAGCTRVTFVGGDPRLAELGRPQVADAELHAGPLAAIASVAGLAQGCGAVIAACDMPSLDAPTVSKLIEAVDAGDSGAVYEVGSVPQWSLVALSEDGLAAAVSSRRGGASSMKQAFGALLRRIEPTDATAVADIDEPTG